YKAGTQGDPGGGTDNSSWTACGSSQGSGYATATFTPSGTLTATTSFACFVTPGGSPTCGTATWASGVIVITVEPTLSYGTANNTSGGGSTQTICYNTSPASMSANSATGSGSFSYQWYYKAGAVTPTSGSNSGWTAASGTGNATATFSAPTAITANTTYACWVTPGGSPSCGSANWAGASNNDNVQITVIATGSWIGTTSTDWNDGSNWCGGSVPGSTIDVEIPSAVPHQPHILGSPDGTCRSITIDNSASLTIDGAYGLNVYGDWTKNGSFTAGTGLVTFYGTGKTIGGTSTTFYNVTLSGSASVTTGVATTISGALSIGNGTTFTAAGYDLTITGTTTVGGGGSLVISSATGTKTFGGLVTVASGATWNNSGNSDLSFKGGITKSGAFSAGTGIYNFISNPQGLSGATLTIPNVTVTGITLTNNGTLNIGTSLDGSGTLQQNNYTTLYIGGTSTITTLTAIALGNIVSYNGTSQTVYETNYYKLKLEGSGTKTLQSGTTSITNDFSLSGISTMSATAVTGLTIGGNFYINGNSTFVAGSYTHAIGGDFQNDGTFTAGTSTISLNGSSGAQTIKGNTASTFNNLTINNSAGVILNNSPTISGTLTFTSGKITTGSYYLILGSSASVSGATAGKYVYGYIRRYVPNSPAPTVGFDIGDATNYAPVSVHFSGTVSGSGYLDASTAVAQPPVASGLSQANYLHRKWTLTNGGVTGFSSYSPTFTFVSADIIGIVSTSAFVIRKWNGSTWSATTTGTLSSLSSSCTGLTSFSDFYEGQDGCQGTAMWFGGTPDHLTDWNTGSNWCSGSVPDYTTDVEIPSDPANQPHIGAAGGSCKNITIDNGASLTMDGAYTLAVSGNWSLTSGGTFTPGTSTVNFNGTAQSISGAGTTTFNNLTLSTSGLKTFTTVPTVNGVLSMEGTATASAAPDYGASATLQYNTATARTAGDEWIATFAATGGVIIANTGTITANAEKAFNTGIPLTVNNGAKLDMSTFAITGLNTVANSGTISSQNTSSTPFPTGLNWGGTVEYYGTGQTIATGTYSTLKNSTGTNNVNSGLVTASTLNVSSGVLNVNPGGQFTATTTSITPAQGLVIVSNATGTGSFITGSSSGTAKVQRYYTQGRWFYSSIPVANATAAVYHLAGGQSNIYLGKFNESLPNGNGSDITTYPGCWQFITSTATALDPGRGYAVWAAPGTVNTTDALINFNGALNTAASSITCYNSDASDGNGWYFVGNPYTSAINRLSGTWTMTGLTGEVHVYDPIYSGNFRTWNGGTGGLTDGIIPQEQGFFVKFASPGGSPSSTTFTIPVEAKTHSSQYFYKDDIKIPDLVKLKISSEINSYFDEAFVYFDSTCTNGTDVNHDAGKMFGLASAPNIFSITGSENYSINGLPALSGPTEVQLGYRVGINGTYHITAGELSSFPPGTTIYLEDQQLQAFQDMNENNVYTFTGDTSNSPLRFRLHFNSIITSSGELNEKPLQVYTDGNTIYVFGPDNIKEIAVYDLLGQELISKKPDGSRLLRLDLKHAPGVYVVKVLTSTRSYSRKVLFN
ncbi:MAG: T9SS type A sorting domain-containing protein, partial [Bacteroidia bacterium]|nr:T9SS type A sorting domain-containing protein [Bacteroidia bacterium]